MILMRILFSTFLLASSMFLYGQCGAQCSNLVTNGDFNNSWSSWTKESGWGISNYAGYTKAAVNSVDNSPSGGYSISQNITGLAGSTVLQITFDAYPQSPNNGTSYLDVYLGSTRYARLTSANGSLQATITLYNSATCVSCGSWNTSTWKSGIAFNVPWSPVTNSATLKFTFISAGSLRDWGIDNISLIPQVTPSVSISESKNNICEGTSVTFTATPVDGGTPSYQWKRNGVNVGSNSGTFTSSSLSNGDILNCVMTSSLSCKTQPNTSSNSITMSVTSKVTPSVVILGDPSVNRKNTVTLTAMVTNGGSNPSFKWYKNGTLRSSSNPWTDSANVAGTDSIKVIVKTSLSCFTVDSAIANYSITVLDLTDVKVRKTIDSIHFEFLKKKDDVVQIYMFNEKTGSSSLLITTDDNLVTLKHVSRYYIVSSKRFMRYFGPYPLEAEDPRKTISVKQLLGQITE